MELDELKAIIDDCPDNISSIKADLRALYHYVGLPIGSSLLSSQIAETLRERLKEALSGDFKETFELMGRLLRQMIHESILLKNPLMPYFQIVEIIKDCSRGESVEVASTDWRKIVSLAKDLWLLGDGFSCIPMLQDFHKRHIEVANAGLVLRDFGCSIEITSKGLRLSDSDEKKICQEIVDRLKIIGGERVIAHILNASEPFFNIEQQRFFFIRQVDLIPNANAHAQLPINFLFQLAMKVPFSQFDKKVNLNEEWKIVQSLSTSLCAIYDLQPYNPFETLFGKINTIMPLLTSMALYDSLFVPSQLKPKYAEEIIRSIVDWCDLDKEILPNVTLVNTVNIALAVLQMLPNKSGPFLLSTKAVSEKISNNTNVKEVLELFSHGLESNSNYLTPTDSPDFMFKPMFQKKSDEYLIMDPCLCASNFIEVILTSLRKIYNSNSDSEVGFAIERFIKSKLADCGLVHKSGKYKVGKIEGEFDIIVETSSHIFLFEVKKKVLTRKAKSGRDTNVLLDLSDSLLAAQIQLGRHEILLHQEEEIRLVEQDGTTATISRQNRKIERIAITFFDFGALHDRVILSQFLRICLNAKFTTSDKNYSKKFSDLETLIEELRIQHSKICAIDSSRLRTPFFNCWFLGVAHLLTMLEDVKNEEDFKNAIFKTRHVVTGTHDFYHDYARAKMLNSNNSS